MSLDFCVMDNRSREISALKNGRARIRFYWFRALEVEYISTLLVGRMGGVLR